MTKLYEVQAAIAERAHVDEGAPGLPDETQSASPLDPQRRERRGELRAGERVVQAEQPREQGDRLEACRPRRAQREHAIAAVQRGVDLGKELRRNAPPSDEERKVMFDQTAASTAALAERERAE